jgi:hypothetical protein
MGMPSIDTVSTVSISRNPGAKIAAGDEALQARIQNNDIEKSADVVVSNRLALAGAGGDRVTAEAPHLAAPHNTAPSVEGLQNALQNAIDGSPKEQSAKAAEQSSGANVSDDIPSSSAKTDLRSLPQGVTAQSPLDTFDFEKNFQIMTKVMAVLLAYAASNRDSAAEFVKIAQERTRQAGDALEQAARDRLGAAVGALTTSAAMGGVAMFASVKAARQEANSVGRNGQLGAQAREQAASAQRTGAQTAAAKLPGSERLVDMTDGNRARVPGDVEGASHTMREAVQHQPRVAEADQHQLGDRFVQARSQKWFAHAQYMTLLANSSGGGINGAGEVVAAGQEVARMQYQLASDTSRQTSEHHTESVTQAMQMVTAMLNVLQNWQRQNIETAIAIAGNMRA